MGLGTRRARSRILQGLVPGLDSKSCQAQLSPPSTKSQSEMTDQQKTDLLGRLRRGRPMGPQVRLSTRYPITEPASQTTNLASDSFGSLPSWTWRAFVDEYPQTFSMAVSRGLGTKPGYRFKIAPNVRFGSPETSRATHSSAAIPCWMEIGEIGGRSGTGRSGGEGGGGEIGGRSGGDRGDRGRSGGSGRSGEIGDSSRTLGGEIGGDRGQLPNSGGGDRGGRSGDRGQLPNSGTLR